VDAPKRLSGVVDPPLHRRVIGDVHRLAPDRSAVRACLGLNLFEQRLAPPADRDRCPGPGQRNRRRPPNPRSRPGHERHFPSQEPPLRRHRLSSLKKLTERTFTAEAQRDRREGAEENVKRNLLRVFSSVTLRLCGERSPLVPISLAFACLPRSPPGRI